MRLYVLTAAALAAQLCSSSDLCAPVTAWPAAFLTVGFAWRLFVPETRLRRALPAAALGALVGIAPMLVGGPRLADRLVALLDDQGRSSRSYEVVADVVDPPKRGAHGSSAVVAVRSLTSPDGTVTRSAARMLVSVRYGSATLRFGHSVRFRTRLRGLRNLGNPGEFDFVAWCARQGIAVSGYLWDDRDIEDLGASSSVGVITRWRAGIAEAAAKGRGAGGALTASLVVGDRSGLDTWVLEALRISGLFHLLAISGMNIAVVAGFALWAVGGLLAAAGARESGYDPYRPAAVTAALAVLLYALLSGGGDSVVRSTIMGLLMLAALWRGRAGDGARSLAAAALVLCAVAPGGIVDVGFQLTFLATAAVLVAVAAVGRLNCPRRLMPLVSSIAISLWCWGVTAPVLAYHFHRVSLVAPAAGLAAGVPAAVVVVAGLTGAFLLPVSPTLASLAFDFAGWAGDAVLWIARLGASPVWAESTVVSPGGPAASALAALPLVVLAPAVSRRRLICALCIVVVACGARAVFDRYRSDRLDVVFASVGQGDASIVRFPGGRVMVVDAGPPGRGRTVVGPVLRRMHIQRIDYLVVTHGQDDHWGGLPELVEEFDIGEVWYPGGECDGAFVEVLARLRARGTRVVDVGRTLSAPRAPGRHSVLGRRGAAGWRMRAIWPRDSRGGCEDNDRSVVVTVTFAGSRILFVGDIEAPAERTLARRRRLRAQLLKVPHHGSRTSSTEGFLDRVRPFSAVASMGWANRFRFPSPDVVDRYARKGIRLYRTDEEGAVRATVTHAGIALKAAHGEPAIGHGPLAPGR